jgi:hypothetical protein
VSIDPIRAAFEAFRKGDVEPLVALIDPAVVAGPAPPPLEPDPEFRCLSSRAWARFTHLPGLPPQLARIRSQNSAKVLQ